MKRLSRCLSTYRSDARPSSGSQCNDSDLKADVESSCVYILARVQLQAWHRRMILTGLRRRLRVHQRAYLSAYGCRSSKTLRFVRLYALRMLSMIFVL